MAKWNIDPDHAVAFFAVKHFMITDVRGQFNRLSGTIFSRADEPLSTSISVAIEVGSLFTGVRKRDEHLLSPDFFDVARFPAMTFKSALVEPAAWNGLRLTGVMTVRGVAREITLDGEFSGPVKSPEGLGGETSMSFALAGRLRPEDFGLAWNVDMENNGVVIGREVRLWANLEADLAGE